MFLQNVRCKDYEKIIRNKNVFLIFFHFQEMEVADMLNFVCSVVELINRAFTVVR